MGVPIIANYGGRRWEMRDTLGFPLLGCAKGFGIRRGFLCYALTLFLTLQARTFLSGNSLQPDIT